MKISFTKKNISPEIGIRIAGYGPDDFTTAKRDDLFLTALGLDNGEKTALVLGYDLIGIDAKYIRRIRRECAAIIGGDESQVILSCTHTHCGPHSRSSVGYAQRLEVEYLEKLVATTCEAAREIMNGKWVDTEILFYALNCDENINRRYVGNDNKCTFLPHRPYLEPLCDGIRDRELGIIIFRNRETWQIEYIIGNYAAHPLAGHAPGLGGHRISADFPGAYRDYLEADVGCGCMFLSGAAGDMVPKGHETGSAAIEEVGAKLAQETIKGVISATRTSDSYRLKNETIQSGFAHVSGKVRPCKPNIPPAYQGQTEVDMELQLFSIGDICLVGVPGEMLAELGLEIKWHSPFRKTFILYCSTDYLSYLGYGNALVQGGYEARQQYFDSHTGLKLVNAAVEGCYELYEKTFPDHATWPENSILPLVSVLNLNN
jgi:hypothetical protein